jgi:hypothetical protein
MALIDNLTTSPKMTHMKPKLMLLSLLLITFSCSKKEDIKFDDVNQLLGKWFWVSACGGFSGGCIYPSSTEHTTIEFNKNGKYVESVNGTIIKEYNYRITEIVYSTSAVYYLNLDSLYSWNIQLLNNELSIYRGDLIFSYKR